MTDPAFIEQILQKGQEAKQKVLQKFSGLSKQQLNWSPSPGAWSIAQCLEHLVISDSAYFATLARIIHGSYTMTFWEKYSPLSTLFGKLLKDQLQEHPKRKMATSRKLVPATTAKEVTFLHDYTDNLNTFLEHISACRNADLDKLIITSPLAGFVTYSLRDAFQFLLQHEHRHINQAMRAREHEMFPERKPDSHLTENI